MERSLIVAGPSALADALTAYLRRRGMQTERVAPDELGAAAGALAPHCYVLEGEEPRGADAGGPGGATETAVARVLARGADAGVSRLLVAASSPSAARRVDALLAAGIECRRAVPGHVVPPPADARTAPGWLPALLRALTGRERAPVPLDVSAADRFHLVSAPDAAEGLYRLMRSNHRRPLLLAAEAAGSAADFAAWAAARFGRPVVPAAGAELRVPPLAAAGADAVAALGWSPGGRSWEGLFAAWPGAAADR